MLIGVKAKIGDVITIPDDAPAVGGFRSRSDINMTTLDRNEWHHPTDFEWSQRLSHVAHFAFPRLRGKA